MSALAAVAAPTQARRSMGSGGEAGQLDVWKLVYKVVSLEAQLAGCADVAQYESEHRVEVKKRSWTVQPPR